MLSRSGSTQNQVSNLSRTAQTTYKRYQAHLTHIAVAFAVVSLVGFSGHMGAIHTRDNASRLLQQTSGVEVNADGTTSAYVAANVASELGIVLAGDVSERSEALSSQSQLLSSDSAYMRKASTVTTDSVSHRDIQTYTVAEGDSVNDVARKFGIKSDTIRWANDLSDSEGISAGDKLTILPVDGVLHTVASGDTADSLAEEYEANATQIIRFNDAEISGLSSGRKVVIPGGVMPAPEPSFNPSTSNFANSFVPSYNYGSSNTTFVGRNSGVSGGDNRHFGGQCTWYVAERKGIYGETWGHAFQWAASAQARGIPTGAEPRVGAIAQRGGGWGGLGHVGVVEEIMNDGMIRVRSMNLSGTWNVHDEVIHKSGYSTYIYK